MYISVILVQKPSRHSGVSTGKTLYGIFTSLVVLASNKLCTNIIFKNTFKNTRKFLTNHKIQGTSLYLTHIIPK